MATTVKSAPKKSPRAKKAQPSPRNRSVTQDEPVELLEDSNVPDAGLESEPEDELEALASIGGSLDDLPVDIAKVADSSLASLNLGAKNARTAPVPPLVITPEMSVFDYLANCRPPLHKKIADIACSQRKVPPSLREEAIQDIYVMWTQFKPDTQKYTPGQIASYANYMAKHSALRTRRDLGAAVRLPGSAFRKRKDGTTYVTPGVLAQAMDWNDMEGWFNTDGEGGEGMSMDVDLSSLELQEDLPAQDDEEMEVEKRLAQLDQVAHLIDKTAYQVMSRLINGFTYKDICAELGIKKGALVRHVTTVVERMGGV